MASLFLLASLSIFSFLCFCNADLVADICAKSEVLSPSDCTETLRSDPQSGGADIQTLGQIAVKKAKIAVKNIVTVATSVQNYNNKGAVSVCRYVCRSALDDLRTISRTLKNMDERSKGDLPVKLSGASTMVETCNDAFRETVEGEPAEVKEASDTAQGRLQVVLIIATML